MAKLTLPKISDMPINVVDAAATEIFEALSGQFESCTTTKVQKGTRVFSLLGLSAEQYPDPIDNLALVNVYEADRKRVLAFLESTLGSINQRAQGKYKVILAPASYLINNVRVSCIAYLVTLLVFEGEEEDQPAGAIFVQAYASSREETPRYVKEYHAQRQRSNSEGQDEFEYDPEPEPEPNAR